MFTTHAVAHVPGHPRHQHARHLHASSRPPLDPLRISGIAGAIAINLGVLLALLRPAELPLPALQALGERIPLQWIEPHTPQPVPPQPPRELTRTVPDPAPREPPTLRSPPAPSAPPGNEPARAIDIATDPAPPLMPAGKPVGDGGIDAGPPTTPAGAQLALLEAPHPAYPRAALMAGREGVVRLLVEVDALGRATAVRIERSSGHRDLDETARRQVLRHWRFHPALHAGRPVAASGLVDVAFTLD